MQIKWFIITGSCIFLNACSFNTPDAPTQDITYTNDNLYNYTEPTPLPKVVKTAEVPQQQISAKNLDLVWVSKQAPEDYTIMLNADDKPLEISTQLMSLPKNQRSAALKYLRNGNNYYTGVYGNYSDSDSAAAALDNLPSDVRQRASVVKWSQVQRLHNL